MKLYKSPVTIHEQIVNDLIADYQDGKNKAICKAIVKIGIDVNKDELIKALHYDRQQYKKGYEDAVKDFAERLTTKIVNTPFGVNCTGETDSYKEGCLHGLVAKQNNVIDMIDNLLKEMVGGNNATD